MSCSSPAATERVRARDAAAATTSAATARPGQKQARAGCAAPWSLEACHATATAAAEAVQAETAEAAELVSVTKSYLADRTPAIVQDCVQMHGGIGVTWEHDIHLYLRRVAVNAALYGSGEQHRERLASLMAVEED